MAPLSEEGPEALRPLLRPLEQYCALHTENRSPTRSLKFALEQRPFLSVLYKAVTAAAAENSSAQRVVCLGGIGFAAVAARRSFPSKTKVASVHPTNSQDTAWQMLLARNLAFANGITDIDCLVKVPSKAWDVLVVEGLDSLVLSDGALQMLRDAAPRASPSARILPQAVRVKACLCAPRDFVTAGLDLSAICGVEQLAATIPWLAIDEHNALLDGCTTLSEPFDVLTLWDAPTDVAKVLAGVSTEDRATLTVDVKAEGLCLAVLYWWEASGPHCKSDVRALHWLRCPKQLAQGQSVSLVATRSLTRIHFAFEGDESPSPSPLSPFPAALRHSPMLRDSVRNCAYKEAIALAVQRAREQRGSAALFEIGSGTGLMTLMAQRAGADRVTGCEVDPQVRDLALRVAAENGRPFGPLGSGFEMLAASFQAAVQSPELRGQYNVLIAELMDDCGLGELIWPFFVMARQHLLQPDSVTVPRRLTIYAALVDVEIESLEGVQLWPLDPFWHCSAVPGLDAIGRHSGVASLDMDRYDQHCRIVSNVVEVLSVDLASVGVESMKAEQLPINFKVKREGVVNSVAWFWRAELFENVALCTAPRSLLGELGSSEQERPSQHCWKQACQVLGPVHVVEGQELSALASHDCVQLRWGLAQQEDPEALLQSLQQQRGLSPELLMEVRDFVNAWLQALAKQEGEPAKALAESRRDVPLEESDQAVLLELFGRLGDFGLHPTTANFLLPMFFGSVTSGSKPGKEA